MKIDMSKVDHDIKMTNLLPDQAMSIWPVLAGFFEKACVFAAGRQDINDVRDAVAQGQMLVHLIWNPDTKDIYGAVASECFNYPKKKVFSLTMAGGDDIEKWAHLWPAFKHVARELGFEQIEVAGRAGWKKFIPGAREIGRIYIEDLNDGNEEKLR